MVKYKKKRKGAAMRYDGKMLYVTDREFISVSLRQLAPIPKRCKEDMGAGAITLTATLGAHTLCVLTSCKNEPADSLSYTHEAMGRGKKVGAEDKKFARGILYLNGYALAKSASLSKVKLTASYV